MIPCTDKRCVIGEGPIWNEKEEKLYFTNGMEKEICILDILTETIQVRKTKTGCAAICFDTKNRMIVSCEDGVFYLYEDGSMTPLYDINRFDLRYANDMKAGPDGRIYVGTQSRKRLGISDKLDGKLFSIDNKGNVRILLEDISLSNGMDWSVDENFFYHTDSDTNIICEYMFDKETGSIQSTGRKIKIQGVDGFTINENNDIYAACWGQGHIAVIDTYKMKLKRVIDIPVQIPASCAFAGKQMEYLAITTAYYGMETKTEKDGGTFLVKNNIKGRKPYLFTEGEKKT